MLLRLNRAPFAFADSMRINVPAVLVIDMQLSAGDLVINTLEA